MLNNTKPFARHSPETSLGGLKIYSPSSLYPIIAHRNDLTKYPVGYIFSNGCTRNPPCQPLLELLQSKTGPVLFYGNALTSITDRYL